MIGWNDDRMIGNGFKLKLDIKKKTFFTVRRVRQWNRLPTQLVDASFLETFKVRLDGPEQPDVAVGVLIHFRGVGLDDL